MHIDHSSWTVSNQVITILSITSSHWPVFVDGDIAGSVGIVTYYYHLSVVVCYAQFTVAAP